jgi:DNA-binding MarR family transcriptional regulator
MNDPSFVPRDRILLFKKRFPQVDVELLQFFIQTMSIFHRVPIMMERYFQNLGLSKGRFQILVQLVHEPNPDGMSISDLASTYRVKSATLTGIIDTLERDGYLERIPSRKDRRRIFVRITKEGKSFMEEFLPIHYRNIIEMVGGLSVEERKQLADLQLKFFHGVAAFLEAEPASDKPVP